MSGDWQPIETAPKDGSAFLAYGVHDHEGHTAAGRITWDIGDHWWAIILWDTWRPNLGKRWVFSKDGFATWSAPTHWMPLPEPPA